MIPRQWIVIGDGASWISAMILSISSVVGNVHPPWLLIFSWMGLHAIFLIGYFFSEHNSAYVRYLYDVYAWIFVSTFAWILGTIAFAFHLARFGLAKLPTEIAIVSVALSAVWGRAWFSGFWSDVVRPYELKLKRF